MKRIFIPVMFLFLLASCNSASVQKQDIDTGVTSTNNGSKITKIIRMPEAEFKILQDSVKSLDDSKCDVLTDNNTKIRCKYQVAFAKAVKYDSVAGCGVIADTNMKLNCKVAVIASHALNKNDLSGQGCSVLPVEKQESCKSSIYMRFAMKKSDIKYCNLLNETKKANCTIQLYTLEAMKSGDISKCSSISDTLGKKACQDNVTQKLDIKK